MRDDKHIALKLRRQGKSYKKISEELGVAKSTLSGWFASEKWSQTIKTELTRKASYTARKKFLRVVKDRQAMWEQWRESAREDARKTFPQLQHNPLFIAGLMLYWGEGDSKLENCTVRLGNTNPDMLRLFSLFLREICAVPKEKMKGGIILYPDLKEKPCKSFWSQATEIPENQFTKTQYIHGKHPTKRLHNGIGIISVPSRQLKEKIFVWIGLFHNKFPSSRV